jgi:hypothetical protein
LPFSRLKIYGIAAKFSEKSRNFESILSARQIPAKSSEALRKIMTYFL